MPVEPQSPSRDFRGTELLEAALDGTDPAERRLQLDALIAK
jgi:hypothetical protein